MNHSLNHAYRLVWNEAIGAYVAVAETARARGKRASGAVLAAAGLALALTAPAASALDASTLPRNGHIATGTATLTQSGNTLNVTQSSQKLVINWGSFDVGASASVNFNQANNNAIALNRVGSGVASQIDGALTANGNVWILNSAGVTFGKTAQVNVGGLVASSLNLSDSDFLAGNYSFTNSGAAGAVSNAGSITAGSVVALVAPVVRNTGSIAAGSIALAAGDQVTLDFGGDGLLGYTIDKAALDALVENDGRLSGDTVSLSARSANAAVATVVNNAGVIEATGLSLNGGHIVLDGGDNGAVHVAGTLDASSAQAQGGDITVTGHTLALGGGATLNANGATGGGTIRVGGGLRGEDSSLANAQDVQVAGDVTVSANATNRGDGGAVVFWADHRNDFAGSIAARGGANGGDGGFVEVSGKGTLNYRGHTDTLAPQGTGGTLLLDPADIMVCGGASGCDVSTTGYSVINEATLEAQSSGTIALLATNSIVFEDLSKNGGDGTITLQPNVSFYAEAVGNRTQITFVNRNNTLEVFGTGYIFIESGGSATGTVGKALSNGSNVGTDANTNQGTFNLVAHGTLAEGAEDKTPSQMPAHVGGGYTLGQVLNQTGGSTLPGAGSITVLGADGLAVSGNLITNGGYIHISGDADSGGVGNLVLSKTVSTNGGNFYMSFGSTGATATLTYGSTVDLSCNNSNTCTDSGHLYTGKDITAAGGSESQSMGESTGKVILGGTLIVGGNLDLRDYTINGGASIETDKDSTITLDTGTTLKPYVLDRTGATTTTTGPIGLQAGSIAINQSDSTLATSLGTVSLQLKPADAGSNLFVNDTQGAMLGDGTVARDGSVSGLTTTSTFISQSDLAYLEAQGVKGLIIGRTDSTGTVEVGNTDGTPNTFTFNTPGNLGLIGGNAVVNGTLTNNSGSVFVQAANTQTVDQTGTSIGTGNLVITANGTIAAHNNIVAAAEGNFVNDSGSDALQAGGRWLVYSTDPSKDEGRNLDVDFKIYEATYGESDGSYTCTAGVCTGNDIAAYDDRGQKNINGVVTNPVGTKADLVQVLNVDEAGNNGYLYKRTAFVDATLVGTVTKTYDGTTATSTTSTVATNPNNPGTSGGTSLTADNIRLLSNGIDGDNVQLSIDAANIGAAQYDSKNVGSGKTVSATGVRLGVATNGGTTDTVPGDNTNPDNSKTVHVYGYRLSSDTVSGDIGTVTAKTISAGTVTADNKVYDGTTTASVGGGLLAGVVSGDSVATRLTGQFDNKNAGTGKTVSVDLGLTGADAANYVLASSTASTTADITAKTVTAGAVSAANKVYDGTTAAAVSGGALSGLMAGDTVSTTLAGQFDDKNAGTGKTVNVGLGLSGADAANYVLASSTASTTADITPKTVTASVTANGKVYDGTTAATLSGLSLDGVLASDADQVAVNEASASFADKNAGTGKTVTVNGLTLTGAEAGNYALATTSTTAQADITAKTISAGAVSAADKVYDGNTVASVSGGALSGIAAGDNVSTTLAGSFDTKNAGTGKTVSVDLGLTGADATNYVLASNTASTTADITPKTVSAGTVTVATKTYDGNTTAHVSGGTVSGLVDGDTVDVTLSGTYDSATAGTGKAVTVTLGLTGSDAANYQLDPAQTTVSGDITAATSAAVVGLQAKGNPGANSTGSASAAVALLPGAAGQATLYSLGVSGAVAGTSIMQLSTDGEVRADGGVSIATEGTGVDEGIAEVNLPVFVAASTSLDFKGWNHVIDQGSSLELKPLVSTDEVTEPRLDGDISARSQARLALSHGGSALMQLTLLADGTLLVEGDDGLKTLTPDTLSAYALSALKRSAHVSVNKVKAVVLRFKGEDAKALQPRG
ncbi:filamentous hemagglutinin N-terminal domain-containing protein [Ideonella sp. B7]|uniref:YDG domain-containing protein n=1 Tax=Ideonella benzenivorans TaxID=2831643 RepID=UPI002105E1C9|nr:YDG domain-containing protein [Ideonella benzenivorans]MCA6215646.1 filamentous hemagglutinin N-terminal domain-containing protein [Ideonella benzenivorans]